MRASVLDVSACGHVVVIYWSTIREDAGARAKCECTVTEIILQA